MLKPRLAVAAGLILVGCTPGNYNINVGVNPVGLVPSPAGTSQATSSAAPTASGPATPASAAASSTPAGAYDQAQDHVSTYQQVGKGSRLAQTFAVKRGGNLTAVAVRLKGAAADRQPILSIVALEHDLPGAAPLTTAKVDVTADAAAWATATLGVPVPVKAGDRYAFVLTLDAPYAVYAGASQDADYPDGLGFTGLTDGSTFWNKLGEDLAFRTTIQ